MEQIELLKFLIMIAYIILTFTVAFGIVNNRFIDRFYDNFVDEKKRLEQKMTVIEREVCSLKNANDNSTVSHSGANTDSRITPHTVLQSRESNIERSELRGRRLEINSCESERCTEHDIRT